MFGHRSDGKVIKNNDPYFKIIPIIMKTRNDSQVYFKQDIKLNGMNEYIEKKAAEGIKVSYMDIIYAALIRVIAMKPQLNRFIMNGRTYQRKGIFVSLAIKKNLTEDGEETTTKNEFTGRESLMEVKEILDKCIYTNKDQSYDSATDSFVKFFGRFPVWFYKLVINSFMFLDKHGLMPKAIIKISPFHTSAFLTNVGSLGIDAIYHHLYNFGTTSLFLSMGKKKKSYLYEDDDIKVEKALTIGFVGDERICDGYYFASAFKTLVKILNKPEVLEQPYDPDEEKKAKETK